MQQPPEGQPQQPYYPPGQKSGPPYQQPPPKKRRRRWPFVLLGILVLCCAILGIIIATSGGGGPTTSTSATTAPTTKVINTPSPTARPTQAPKWTTTRTFSGNGSKKTQTFSVPDDWKINWTCKPSSFTGDQYNLVIFVYNSDGSLADSGVNTICKAGNTADSSEIHRSGTVYLDVISEGDWTVQVQELK